MKLSQFMMLSLVFFLQFSNLTKVSAIPNSSALIAGIEVPRTTVVKEKKSKKEVRQERKKYNKKQRQLKKNQRQQKQFFKQQKTNGKARKTLNLGVLFLSITLGIAGISSTVFFALTISGALFILGPTFLMALSTVISLVVLVMSVLSIIYLLMGITRMDKDINGKVGSPLWVIGLISILMMVFSCVGIGIMAALLTSPGWILLPVFLFIASIILTYIVASKFFRKKEGQESKDYLERENNQ